MPNVLVLYYSSYGHIELMARAQAEGAARIPKARVLVKRVPETVPPEIAKTSGFKLDQAAPIANPEELDQYDAIIFGTPTRFGTSCSTRVTPGCWQPHRTTSRQPSGCWRKETGARSSIGRSRITTAQ